MTKRKVENIEALLGMKGATVVADVTGTKVQLLAIHLGDAETNNILPLILPFMLRRIEEHLRDYTVVGNVYDWDTGA